MRIGAHVSTAGTLDQCVDRALAIGAETIQIFASGPQSWRAPAHDPALVLLLRQRAEQHGIAPVWVHGVYLINLASPDPALVERSVRSLVASMTFAAAAGAAGVIFHTGSHKGTGFDAALPGITRALERVLHETPDQVLLALENSAGGGGSVGAGFAELGAILRATGNAPRLRVCLDTCHAFAAGYDIRTDAGVAAAMDEFEREVGLDRLIAVHANDSKAGLGSGLDRHENIGRGQIGEAGFRALLAHPASARTPFILEVPGMAGAGPDRENIEILHRLAVESGRRRTDARQNVSARPGTTTPVPPSA